MPAIEVTAGSCTAPPEVGDEADEEVLAAAGEVMDTAAAPGLPLVTSAAVLLRSWATRRPRTPGLRFAGGGAKAQARLRWAH